MKKTRLLIVGCLFANFSIAQLAPTWNIQLEDELNWHKVTSEGQYLISSASGLKSLNQDSGELLWQNAELAGYAEEQISEISGSPLLMSKKDGQVIIFSPFDGEIKFDSEKQGFSEFNNSTYLQKTSGLLVAGKTAGGEQQIIMIDVNNGTKRWSINEKFGRVVSINEQNEKEFIITTLFYVYKINSLTGDILWKNSVSSDSAMNDNPLGELFMDMAEKMTEDMDFVIRYYQNVEKNKFIIASEVKNETQTSDGKTVVSYRNNYTAFNLSDGERVWEQPVEMKGNLGDLAFYNNGVIILPDDGNRTTINFYEFASSNKGTWGKKGKGTSIKGGVYSHVNTGNGFLLITKSGSNNFLNFLDPTTGEMTFDKPIKISGEVQQTFVLDAGILYITSEEANVINTSTGEQLLAKSIITSPRLSQMEGNLLYAFDKKTTTLVSLDLSTLLVTPITSEKLKFEGKEEANSIEIRENGILVSSEQNLALFTKTGELTYQKYYPAPRESGLKRALLVAQAARASYIAVQAYSAAGVAKSATPSVREKDAVSGAIVEGVGTMYEDLGDKATDFAKKSFKQAQERFKATSEARDFVVIFTTKDKDNYLSKVNKNNGEVEAEISLGKEQQPKYAFDDVTGKIFTVSNTKTLNGFDLN